MITTLYRTHRRLIWTIGTCVLILTLVLIPETAFAQTGDQEVNKILRDIQQYFTMMLQFMSSWLWPILLMIGGLLDNQLIFGGEMGERLLSIWVQIRNIVNVLFVLILLVIALYNVLGLPEEGIGGFSLSLKTTLPKFVIALIAVNFSFLAAKVMLDFTNVLTVAAFSLPGTVSEESFQKQKTSSEDIICRDGSAMQPLFCSRTGDKWQYNAKANAFFEKLSGNNVSLIMALNFGKLAHQRYVKEGLKDITQLTFNILFGLVMYTVYAISFIALFIVLLVRLVVLWVVVALSPLIAVNIVAPGLLQNLSLGEGGGPGQMFIKHATAPLIIAVFLSVGYLMLEAFTGDPGAASGYYAGIRIDSVDPNALPTEIADLQQLIIAVAAVVVVWMGVFGATKGTFAEGITNALKTHAEGFGKWLGKLPLYVQIIPVQGEEGEKGEKMSLLGAFRTMTTTDDVMDRKFGKSLWDMKGEGVGDPNEIGNASRAQAAQKLKDNITALQSPLGVEALRKQMMTNFRFGEDEVKNRTYEELARKIYSDKKGTDLRPSGIASADEFIAAVEGKAKKSGEKDKDRKLGAVQVTNGDTARQALEDIAANNENASIYKSQKAFGKVNESRLKTLASAYNNLGASTKSKVTLLKDGQLNVAAVDTAITLNERLKYNRSIADMAPQIAGNPELAKAIFADLPADKRASAKIALQAVGVTIPEESAAQSKAAAPAAGSHDAGDTSAAAVTDSGNGA